MRKSAEVDAIAGRSRITGVDVDEMLRFAALHSDAGSLALARELYRRVLDRQPSHVAALHELALIDFRVGEHTSALDLSCQGIRLRPSDFRFHTLAGRSAKALGRLDEAVRYYRRAIRLAPRSAELHVSLGVALRAQGRLDDPSVIEVQVRRMLADKRSDDFVNNFTTQWLSITKMQTVSVNKELFPRFLYLVSSAVGLSTHSFRARSRTL